MCDLSSKDSGTSKQEQEDHDDCQVKWNRNKIRELVLSWADYTTIHGIRFLVSSDDPPRLNCFSPRRITWLFIVLISTAFVIRQISERIIYYNSLPISVNVEIFNNHSLKFPTITFCNQNSFKMTRAYESGYYDTIIDFYLKDKGTMSHSDDITNLKLNQTIDQLFNLTSFKLDDMLLECKWLGNPCYAENFTELMTDLGMCYSFNAKAPYFKVDDSGTGKGLVLLLNIQQYDYIPQNFGSAGIRFLAHPPDAVPMITEKGDAAQTGTHTFVGLKIGSTFNDAMKTKQCAKFNGSDYRYDRCFLNARTEFYVDRCNCREIYMPDLDGNSSFCPIRQLKCLNEVEKEFAIKKHQMYDSMCPVDCEEINIESSLSSLSLTTQDMDNINDIKDIVQQMEESYIKSRDIARLAIDNYYRTDMDILKKTTNSIKNTFRFFSEALSRGQDMETTFKLEKKNILSQLNVKIQFLTEQETLVRKLFYDGYESAKSRTLGQVSHNMFEFVMRLKEGLKHLANSEFDNATKGMILYETSLVIAQRKAGSKAAYKKLYELYDCLKNSKPYWKLSDIKLSDNDIKAIIPKKLLRKIPDMLDVIYNLKWYSTSLKNLTNVYNMFNESLYLAYRTQNYSIDETNANIKQFLKSSKEWDHFRSSILDLIVPKPVEVLKNKIEQAKLLKSSLTTSELMGIPKFTSLIPSLKKLRKNYFLKILHQLIHKCISARKLPSKYQQSPLLLKSWLTQHFSNNSAEISLILKEVDNTVSKLSSYRSRWPWRWQLLNDISENVWQMILSDSDAFDQYKLRNKEDWLKMNVHTVTRNISRFTNHMATQISCFENSENCQNPLRDIINVLISDLKEYESQNSINTELIRRNVLRVEFFFRQLRWEKVIKEWSYEFAALISDIGGAIGLFVGGSILSVIEVIDLVILILSAARKQVHQHASAYIEEKRIEKEEKEAYYRPMPFLIRKEILKTIYKSPMDDIQSNGDTDAV